MTRASRTWSAPTTTGVTARPSRARVSATTRVSGVGSVTGSLRDQAFERVVRGPARGWARRPRRQGDENAATGPSRERQNGARRPRRQGDENAATGPSRERQNGARRPRRQGDENAATGPSRGRQNGARRPR